MPKLFERPEGGHALDLYEAVVGSHPPGGRNQPLQHAWAFSRLYPHLDKWLAAPLTERIGASVVRRGPAYASLKGRQYIYFLASIGRCDLDWDWIIGVGDHRFREDFLPPAVRAFGKRLGEQLVTLGYKRGHERIGRAIRLFYLRHGEGVINVGESAHRRVSGRMGRSGGERGLRGTVQVRGALSQPARGDAWSRMVAANRAIPPASCGEAATSHGDPAAHLPRQVEDGSADRAICRGARCDGRTAKYG